MIKWALSKDIPLPLLSVLSLLMITFQTSVLSVPLSLWQPVPPCCPRPRCPLVAPWRWGRVPSGGAVCAPGVRGDRVTLQQHAPLPLATCAGLPAGAARRRPAGRRRLWQREVLRDQPGSDVGEWGAIYSLHRLAKPNVYYIFHVGLRPKCGLKPSEFNEFKLIRHLLKAVLKLRSADSNRKTAKISGALLSSVSVYIWMNVSNSSVVPQLLLHRTSSGSVPIR